MKIDFLKKKKRNEIRNDSEREELCMDTKM